MYDLVGDHMFYVSIYECIKWLLYGEDVALFIGFNDKDLQHYTNPFRDIHIGQQGCIGLINIKNLISEFSIPFL